MGLKFSGGSADVAVPASIQREGNSTSVSTITSSLLSQIAGSSTAANQFVTDLNQLVKDVKSGDLSAAQQDWVTLSEDAQNGVASSTATTSDSGIDTTALSDIAASSSSSSSFVNELNLLGTDVENGDLSTAQNDVQSLAYTAQSAVSSASAATSTKAGSPAEIAELIRAIVAALGAGDSSAASSVLSELASVSPNSKGAAALQQQSESLGSTSGSTGNSSSLSSLLQSLSSSGSTSASSGLSLLA